MIEDWSWRTILAVTAAYWLSLPAAWYFYQTRPSVRATRLERAMERGSYDPEAGRISLSEESTIDVLRVAPVLFGPPALLVIVWLVLRAGS
jgi:hypothetical protein